MIFPANWLKDDSSRAVSASVRINAMLLINNDSPINCRANCDLNAPDTLRMPTSLALSEDLAVVRFTKLMQAITIIKTAMMEKNVYVTGAAPCLAVTV